jgi:desumoylating isopeptidase 1
MYRPPGAEPPTTATNTPLDPQLASSIVQAVASQAANGSASTNTNSLTSPMHVITNPATFNNFLKTHKAVVAFFTSATCPPCRMIEPVFERLSEEKGLYQDRDGAGFAKIDIDVGMGKNLATEWGVRATPTFMFFLDGKKVRLFFLFLISLVLIPVSLSSMSSRVRMRMS